MRHLTKEDIAGLFAADSPAVVGRQALVPRHAKAGGSSKGEVMSRAGRPRHVKFGSPGGRQDERTAWRQAGRHRRDWGSRSGKVGRGLARSDSVFVNKL